MTSNWRAVKVKLVWHEVAAITTKLLAALPQRATPPRTREGERDKARLRWARRAPV